MPGKGGGAANDWERGNVTSLFDWNVRCFSENLDLEVEALPQVLRGSSSVSSRFVDIESLNGSAQGLASRQLPRKRI